MSPQVRNSRFIKFERVTLTNMTVNDCSNNIVVSNSNVLANGRGLLFESAQYCPRPEDKTIIDGVTFDRVASAESTRRRLSLVGVYGAQISNCTFTGVATSNSGDGVLLQGSHHIEVGPGNHFKDIRDSTCSEDHRPCRRDGNL